jgi:hypothetical protein
MAVEVQQSDYGVVIVRISGKLGKSDMDRLQATALTAIQQWNKIRVLVKVEDFRGWEQNSDSGDVTFMNEEGRNIEKMAIVGAEAWRDMFYAFTGKGFRATAIEYFLPSEHDRALNWLGEASRGK